MSQLIAVITKRLNPTGLKEIVVRPFGNNEVEIVVPEVDPAEINNIKQIIRTGGVLQFMIVASDERDGEVFEVAKIQSEKPGEVRLYRGVVDADGRQVGYWAKLAREKDEKTGSFRAIDTLANGYLRDSRTGEILDLTPQQKRSFAGDQSFLDSFLKQRGTTGLDVLTQDRILFELEGVTRQLADEAMRLGAAKLPIKTRFVSRDEQFGE
jgi:SecD/SecF fusion protein